MPEIKVYQGIKTKYARIFTDATAVINISMIKDHSISGYTGLMKNMTHGNVNNPHEHHANQASPQIAMLYNPARDAAPDFMTKPAGWNGRLIYTFGGGCMTGWFRQGATTGGVEDDVMLRQGVCGQPRGLANLLRKNDFAGKTFGHVLQPCGDIDRVAKRGEHNMIAVADVAHDNFTAVNAETKPDRLMQIVAEKFIQLRDIGGDHGRRFQRLAARDLRAAAQPEQRQLAVADELIGLTTAFDHRL